MSRLGALCIDVRLGQNPEQCGLADLRQANDASLHESRNPSLAMLGQVIVFCGRPPVTVHEFPTKQSLDFSTLP
jgi:hypothetical protein